MRSLLSRACVAAVALTAATYAGAAALGAPPAEATAACSTVDGVTVVVDFHDLGGGVQQVCDPDGGGTYATALFTGNGFDLTYAQKQPGFVCRIEAKPADDPCVNTPPADAYWGLWWSDGTKATWTYSSLGASSLKVPDGGSVAFSWNRGAGQDKPGVNPPKHAQPTATPTSSASPTSGGNDDGNGNGNNQGGSGDPSQSPSAGPQSSTPTASPEPSASPTKKPKPERPTESSTPELTPTATVEPTPEIGAQDVEATASPPAADDQGGLPTWLAPVVVVLLFGAAAGVAVVRRRRSSESSAGP